MESPCAPPSDGTSHRRAPLLPPPHPGGVLVRCITIVGLCFSATSTHQSECFPTTSKHFQPPAQPPAAKEKCAFFPIAFCFSHGLACPVDLRTERASYCGSGSVSFQQRSALQSRVPTFCGNNKPTTSHGMVPQEALVLEGPIAC